jgi:phage shock protein B
MFVDELVSLLEAAPVIIFTVIVAPMWLILHYRSKRQLNKGLSEKDFEQLNGLAQSAEKMNSRIKTLEAILDAEAPQWRNKV